MGLGAVIEKWGGHEVAAMDVYRDVFHLGEGYLQKQGDLSGEFKANPVAYWKNEDEENGHFRIMFEDTFEETLQELQQADFSILNGVTYFGRRNVQSHASKMFAMIFDIDGVTESTLGNFFSGSIRGDAYPLPQYVILSGHGVHLYYVFERPIPLFPNLKLQLKELKYALTEKIWNMYTSTEKKKQMQGINQGFRVIGSRTKAGSPEPVVRAFQVNQHPVNLDQLCEYVPDEFKVDEDKLFRESKLTLEQAKRKYPEWYEKVVVQRDRTPKKWDIAGKVNGDNPYALYDWWLRKIYSGASYGHRYFNIMCLAIYAAKNDVPWERLQQDAYELIPFMNSLKEDAPFTESDVDVALECYDLRYCTFPRKDIEKISGIRIEPNKRNGRKQAVHLGRIRAMQQYDDPDGEWRNKKGRSKGSGTAQMKVAAYRDDHPEATVTEVANALGISRPTVYKWWNFDPEELERQRRIEVETLMLRSEQQLGRTWRNK